MVFKLFRLSKTCKLRTFIKISVLGKRITLPDSGLLHIGPQARIGDIKPTLILDNSLYTERDIFVQHGADSNKKNRDGHVPLDLVKPGDTDVEDLLRGEQLF